MIPEQHANFLERRAAHLDDLARDVGTDGCTRVSQQALELGIAGVLGELSGDQRVGCRQDWTTTDGADAIGWIRDQLGEQPGVAFVIERGGRFDRRVGGGSFGARRRAW